MPPRATLPALREAVQACRGCALWERATQAVFGEGPRQARLVLVGEQPGNDEDLAGRPFVGPAGRLLDELLAAAGIPRQDAWVTNAVKHFKWVAQGTRRIHQKPGAREIAACRPWLEAELRLVRPQALLCLGATAAQAVFGPAFRLTRQRGVLVPSPLAPLTMATLHPSAILRAPDDGSRRAETARVVEELRALASHMDRAAQVG